ncbi:MAG: hypothetical protein ACFWTX_03015 [Acidaminococcus timonensis]|jgi:hypothetical protein
MHKGRFMKAAVLGLCAALLLPSACLAAKGKKGIPGPARKICPLPAKPDSGPLPYPKCSPPSPSCSWWMKEN